MSYKLYYFDGRGLAEPIRMILTYGGIEFEDIRVPIPTNNTTPPPLPQEIKDKCTWGQVPLIEFEGKKLAQSLAITRYFAKKFNLVGSDDFEAAQCDEYVDSIREFWTCLTPLVIAKVKNEPNVKSQVDEVTKTAREKFLVKFSKIVEDNGGKWMVGKKLTWADLYLAHFLNNAKLLLEINFEDEYPPLKSLSDGVFNTPEIKKWMDKRPDTKF